MAAKKGIGPKGQKDLGAAIGIGTGITGGYDRFNRIPQSIKSHDDMISYACSCSAKGKLKFKRNLFHLKT